MEFFETLWSALKNVQFEDFFNELKGFNFEGMWGYIKMYFEGIIQVFADLFA